MKNRLSLLAAPYVLWMALFTVIPILIMVFYAFTTSDSAELIAAGQWTQAFTLDNFARMGDYLVVFVRSFRLALVATAVCLLIGYPVSYLIPALRRGGRKTQRNLALVFSVLGYLIGFLAAVLDDGAAMEKVVFGTYLISGTTLAVCTLLHFKASGHTCGCSGPIAALSIFINPWFLVGYVLLTPIIWSSIRLKRHTALQLLAGCVIPVLAMLICRAQFL